MSRTYRHITKSGEKTKFAKKMYMQWFESQSYYDSKEEAFEKFLIQFHREGYRHTAPKNFRKKINNMKRNQDKQKLIRHLKEERLDDMSSFKWLKDAGYHYF